MVRLGMEYIPGSPMRQILHQFEDYDDDHKSTNGIIFPFEVLAKEIRKANFMINFNVSKGDQPFLIGIPSLKSIRSSLNFEYEILMQKSMDVGTICVWIAMKLHITTVLKLCPTELV